MRRVWKERPLAAPIDLRSDTVTRPTDAMRAAMAAAPVGDDQYGEDPSTNRLQARMAEMLGKEAALWLPTGTMANQVAVRTLTRPGDEVVACRESHLAWHEVGGAAANAGVQIHEIGHAGVFSADELRAAAKPRNFAIFPTTSLMAIENTHNPAASWCRRPRRCASALWRASSTWPLSWTARGCGTPAPPAAWRCTSWPRRSTSCPWPSARG